MIAPRHLVRHRDADYPVSQRGEAWVITVAGAEYFLTAGDGWERPARAFLKDRMTNPLFPDRPGFVATQRYPLLLSIDDTIVRAWPALVPRETGAKTYGSPKTGERLLNVRGPVWMFATRGRAAGEGGKATNAQRLADVAQLAAAWLDATSARE